MPVELGTCATGDDAKALPSCLHPERKRDRVKEGEGERETLCFRLLLQASCLKGDSLSLTLSLFYGCICRCT